MKIKINQSGFIGIAELGLIILLVGIIGFTGNRVYKATRQVDETNQQTVDVAEKTAEYNPSDKIDKLEEVPAEDKPTETPPTEEKPKTTTTTETKVEDKPTVTTIGMTYVNMVVNEDNLVFVANLDQARTGKCEVTLKNLSFEIKPYGYKDIDNSSVCEVSIPKSAVPGSGEWTVKFSYRNYEYTVKGYATATQSITL